jgi:hypothetical protein
VPILIVRQAIIMLMVIVMAIRMLVVVIGTESIVMLETIV